MTKEDVYSILLNFMKRQGGSLKEWYVGITSDILRRLFVDHNVDMKAQDHTALILDSSDEARSIEKYFLDKVGVDGVPEGADKTACFVYLYKKSPRTKP
jgi:hypothetical protein